jgi:CRP-like cAMP-binding protein
MPAAPTVPARNTLLDVLPRRQRANVLAACETVTVAFGDLLAEPNQPLTHVYFPLTAFISQVVSVTGHPPLEMNLIGSEGMLGEILVLGVKTAPVRAVVQGPGTVLRMSAKRFSTALRNNAALSVVLSRYLYVLIAQLAQSTACTRFHEVNARLVRWLLMSHDRAHADHFYLTHQFLADMLGVQRSAVTIAAGVLQQQGLISYSRGEITIMDRPGLEALSCECYGVVNEAYQRVFPVNG